MAENLVGGFLGGKVLATKADDSLRTGDVSKVVELVVSCLIVNTDFIVRGDIGKTKM